MTGYDVADYTFTWVELTAELAAIQQCYYGYAMWNIVCAYDDVDYDTYCYVYENYFYSDFEMNGSNPSVYDDEYYYYLSDFLWMFAERDYVYYIYGDNCDYCLDYYNGVYESECESTDYFDNMFFIDVCDEMGNGDDCSAYYYCDDTSCSFYATEFGEALTYTLEDLSTWVNDTFKCGMGYNMMIVTCSYDAEVTCNGVPQVYGGLLDDGVTTDWTIAPTVDDTGANDIPLTPGMFVMMF